MMLPKQNALIAFVAVPVLLAALSWFIGERLCVLDKDAFTRILVASRTPFDYAVVPPWSAPLYALILVGADIAGFAAGVKLSRVARIIVWVQLFVGLIVIQCLFAMTFNVSGHPLAYGVSLTMGMLGGYAVRVLLRREDKYEAQYYELVIKNRELQETRLQIVKQDEIERRTLAADLHDQVLNDLKVLKQKLVQFKQAPSDESARELDELLGNAMSQVRDVMDSLCPSVLEHIGLAAAIEECLRSGASRGGYKVRFRNSTDKAQLEQLSMVEQSLLFRLVQETVTNICKHAKAQTVHGSIEFHDQNLKIVLADDGKGFDFALLNSDSRGLRFMRQRADLIGATIAWQHGADDKGTVVEIGLKVSGSGETG